MPSIITESEEGPVRVDLDLLNWRYEQLERAGYPVDIAISLSARCAASLSCEPTFFRSQITRSASGNVRSSSHVMRA